MEYICSICQSQYLRITNNTTCSNPICKKEFKKARNAKDYLQKKVDRKCIYCLADFRARRHEYLCLDCKGKRKLTKLKTQNIVCRKCLTTITGTKLVKTLFTKPAKGRKLCVNCKIPKVIKPPKVKKEIKLKIKVVKPIFIRPPKKEVKPKIKIIKQTITILCSYCGKQTTNNRKTCSDKCLSQFLSARMKAKNPMYDRALVAKVHKTIKRRRDQGLYHQRTGKDHWFYKGNRPLGAVIRTRLYPVWTKPILARDGFLCTRCKGKKNLHVHHIKSFRTIYTETLETLEINQDDVKDFDMFSDQVETIIKAVINNHKLEYGITLCHDCHGIIDDRYRRKTI